MSSEIQQAVERLRRWLDGFMESDEGDSYRMSGQDFEDTKVIFSDWWKEHDPTPLDESWLRSVGRESTLTARVYGFYFGCTGLELNVCRDARNRWQVEITQDDQKVALGKSETRGDIRRLCACLGITLHER